MLRAYGQLFAWKLSLHGVNPASTSQKVGRGTFQAINGHRDAGSTACPGKYLYAQIPLIRQYATQAAPAAPAPTPVEVSEPNPQNNLDASPYPDLLVRRASDGRGLVIPTGGLTSFQQRTVVGKSGWDKRADVLVSPDLTGDGVPDLVTARQVRRGPDPLRRRQRQVRRHRQEAARSAATRSSPPSATSTATAATTSSPASRAA